ncbi:MAG: multidrug effflux MFS transporter [Gammaproteobacteria bacterium]|nr:multidrug effflux MFS transporter [Gammaproteobacteria bacterium]
MTEIIHHPAIARRLRSPLVTLIIAGFTALGPLSTDMFLPALPGMVQALGTSIEALQLTLSVYLFGFALSHLCYGPLADRYGRRPVLAAGLVAYVLASAGCAQSTSVETLIAFRLLQAFGASAAIVIGRAMIRDIYGPLEAGRVLSYMASIMAVAPMLAPTLGGYLTSWLGWSSVFWVLGSIGLAGLILLLVVVPESFPERNLEALRPGGLWRSAVTLLRHRLFLGYAATSGSLFAAFFAFISGAPYVFVDHLGMRPEHFGFLFMGIGGVYMVTTAIVGRVHHRYDSARLTGVGAGLAAAAGVAMLVVAALDVGSALVLICPQFVLVAAAGMVLPQSLAGALAPFPRIAGSASALLGFLQMVLAAVVGGLVGLFHDGGPMAMAVAMAVAGLATVLAWAAGVRPRSRSQCG